METKSIFKSVTIWGVALSGLLLFIQHLTGVKLDDQVNPLEGALAGIVHAMIAAVPSFVLPVGQLVAVLTVIVGRFTPAQNWATAHGFTLPLSMLVIYDSFIQSGAVLAFLRTRFAELPPCAGGDEKVWITQYVDVRHNWLRLYDDPLNPAKSALLRTSCYRTGDLKRAITAGNWDLDQEPFVANGANIYGSKGESGALGVQSSGQAAPSGKESA